MFNLKNLFTRALLALMLVTGAGAASAGPIYHVTIDTTSLTGQGVFDFMFLGDATSAGAASATLSNFSGNFVTDMGADMLFGDAIGNVASTVLLGNAGGYAELLQLANLGGKFGFDLRFEVAPAGDSTTLGIALLNAEMDAYLGLDGNLVQFELVPGAEIGVSADNAFGTVTTVSEVPEPASLAMLALGLALMAWTARARRMH
jgi:hypothetical protein